MLNRNVKRVKGVPVDWNELKKRRNLNLTDTAWKLLEEKGVEMGGISRSEVIERLARFSGGIQAPSAPEETRNPYGEEPKMN